jgi:hypothetical protein
MEPKKLGIWMDYVDAHLMEFVSGASKTKTRSSDFTFAPRKLSGVESANQVRNKEQHHQAEYYKKLGEEILNYEEVILFGPTNAKVELLNILRSNHLFREIKIYIEQTDKMTENQQHGFVIRHFSKN